MGCTQSSAPPTSAPSALPDEITLKRKESMDETQTWQIFSELETIDEAETLVLANFMQSLMDHTPVPKAFEGLGDSNPPSPETSENASLKVDGIQVVVGNREKDFEHHELKTEMTMSSQTALDILNLYKNHGKLSRSSLESVLKHAYLSLQKLSNVNRIDVGDGIKLTVVGDIHGQIEDLFHILESCGWPSASNFYLFNGDFVDRGKNGVEVVTILFALQAAFPSSVFLNRGNHEVRSICNVYGFSTECDEKYDREVYDEFCEVFKHIPIASVVNKAVFVVHGGLFHRGNVKISDLETIERYQFEGGVEDPKSPENVNDPRGYDLRCIMVEALWSDPNRNPQHTISFNARGAGVSFGPSIASQFLQVNKLSLIVRSHECVKDGVEWPFQGELYSDKLCTLFSASNYEGRGNIAAYMVFQNKRFGRSKKVGSADMHYEIEYFTTSKCDEKEAKQECKHLLHELLVKKSKALKLNFTVADTDRTGFISNEQWADVMQNVTKVNVMWLSIIYAVVPAYALSPRGVEYEAFLSKYQAGVDPAADMNALYAQKKKLEAIFRFFDSDGNGTISREEFKAGCEVINKILPSEKQLTDPDAILNMMDFDGNDSIDMNEFFETFRILDAKDGVVDGVISMATNRQS